MIKVLVIANCQTYGLVNCLNLCCENIIAHGCDIKSVEKELDSWLLKMKAYDYIITFPGIHAGNMIDFMGMSNVVWIPSFYFSGFHPDTSFATHNGIGINTTLDGYNSRLILTGYKYGLDQQQTKMLFNFDTFKNIGYLDEYEQSKKSLIEVFSKYEIDIRSSFMSWLRDGVFAHGVNHPKINVLYDIAVLTAQKIGLQTRIQPHRPHDNLLNGPIFPVYTEIAEFYGLLGGSYFFKYAHGYQTQSLIEFINSSYEIYKKYDIDSIHYSEIQGVYGKNLKKIIDEIRK